MSRFAWSVTPPFIPKVTSPFIPDESNALEHLFLFLRQLVLLNPVSLLAHPSAQAPLSLRHVAVFVHGFVLLELSKRLALLVSSPSITHCSKLCWGDAMLLARGGDGRHSASPANTGVKHPNKHMILTSQQFLFTCG